MDFVSLDSKTEWNSNIQFALSLLNAVLNYKPTTTHLSIGRRSIFPDLPLFKERKLPGALMLKPGIQQAIRPAWGNLHDYFLESFMLFIHITYLVNHIILTLTYMTYYIICYKVIWQ